MAALKITFSAYEALTTQEKLDLVGKKLFTPKQNLVIKTLLNAGDFNSLEDLANDADLSKRSLSRVIVSLNKKYNPDYDSDCAEYNDNFINRDECCWGTAVFYEIDEEILNSEFLCFDHLTEAGLIECIEEETQEEETPAAQETETQEEETQAAPKAKRLKASTLKSYDAKALAKHLDKLPSDSYRVDFQYGTIYEWMETDLRLCSDLEVSAPPSSYVFYSTLIDKDKIKEAILDVYHELGI